MTVGLIDVDGRVKRSSGSGRFDRFPNLPLMKLSAWHKANGDDVEWCFPMKHYDRVYASKVFTFTPDIDFNPLTDDFRSTNYDSVLRVRQYDDDESATSAIWDKLCRDLRRVMGWTGAKAGHNLRKDSTDTIYQAYGIDYAVAFSGDTEQVLRRHYIGKKKIDVNVRSIAKL